MFDSSLTGILYIYVCKDLCILAVVKEKLIKFIYKATCSYGIFLQLNGSYSTSIFNTCISIIYQFMAHVLSVQKVCSQIIIYGVRDHIQLFVLATWIPI